MPVATMIRKLICAACMLVAVSASAQQRQVYAIKGADTLWWDHYRPAGKANGSAVLFIHGGSFTGGNPANQKPMGEGLAARGYHVFVIRYRLALKDSSFGCRTPTALKLQAVRTAAEDALDATRALLDRSGALGFDSARLFLSGSSAGAEAALNLAFDPFRLGRLPQYRWKEHFRYAGVLAFAGAVIDPNTLRDEDRVPLFLMHGTKDQLVPFGTAAHRFCSANDAGWMLLYGSGALYELLKTRHWPLRLYSFPGKGHEVSNYMFRRFDEMDAFMRAAVDGSLRDSREIVLNDEPEKAR